MNGIIHVNHLKAFGGRQKIESKQASILPSSCLSLARLKDKSVCLLMTFPRHALTCVSSVLALPFVDKPGTTVPTVRDSLHDI